MKLTRWLFSNIILIAFILALTYAYVYWDNLTGPDTPAGNVIALLTNELESVPEIVESYQPATDATEQDVAATAETVVAEQQAAESEPPRTVPVAPPRQPLPASPVRQPAPTVEQAVAPSAEPAAPPAAPPVTGVAAASTGRQLWTAARTAFQNGQYQESIGLYRDLVAADADNFDAWGEMGNVYLRTGDTRQASAAYYEAAAIMVRLGQPARARTVLPLLYRLDRNRARQLSELISRPVNRGGV